jgi:hypothetical protein
MSDFWIVASWSAACWCVGGTHGLWLARTHQGRMWKWADKVVKYEAERTH